MSWTWDDENKEHQVDWKLVAQYSPREFGRFLRSLRERAKLTQGDIGYRVGINQTYVSMIETGKRDIRRVPIKRLLQLLRAYGLKDEEIDNLIKAWSLHTDKEKTEPPEDATEVRPYRLPVVEGGAGSPSFEDAREFMLFWLPPMKGKKETSLFAVKITGNSMEPLLYEGDYAIVDTETPPLTGAIVAVGIPGDGIVVKKLAERNKQLYLESVNPLYEDIPLPEDAKIWGPVISVVRNFHQGFPSKKLKALP
ncbi:MULTISPECIES: LexA family protein [Thermus]|uniref:LexA family protein n=1 Tax=Thermus brockianus TaxID=56956 RepID=UPI001F433E66|nr:S24 family peptidase [Thermus brockianus]